MKKKVDYLQKIYDKNPATGNYVIEVALDKYTDVFNNWDNSSYKKRDMDPDLAYFLEDCGDDIPYKNGLDICFYLPKEIKERRREEVLIVGIKTYYSFYLHHQQKKLREINKHILVYVIISFAILATKMFLVTILKPTVIFNAVSESMNVWGWVFLWEAVSQTFLTRSDNVSLIKKYKRFVSSNIYFRYSDENQEDSDIDNAAGQ